MINHNHISSGIRIIFFSPVQASPTIEVASDLAERGAMDLEPWPLGMEGDWTLNVDRWVYHHLAIQPWSCDTMTWSDSMANHITMRWNDLVASDDAMTWNDLLTGDDTMTWRDSMANYVTMRWTNNMIYSNK